MSVGDAVAAEDAAARTASYLYSPCPYTILHIADQLSLSLRSLAHSLAYHLPVIAIGPWRVHTHVMSLLLLAGSTSMTNSGRDFAVRWGR